MVLPRTHRWRSSREAVCTGDLRFGNTGVAFNATLSRTVPAFFESDPDCRVCAIDRVGCGATSTHAGSENRVQRDTEPTQVT